MQALALVAPVIATGWVFAGGWERAENLGLENAASSSDGWVLVALHAMLVVPPLCMALFTILASVWVWVSSKTSGDKDQTKAVANKAKKVVKVKEEGGESDGRR